MSEDKGKIENISPRKVMGISLETSLKSCLEKFHDSAMEKDFEEPTRFDGHRRTEDMCKISNDFHELCT